MVEINDSPLDDEPEWIETESRKAGIESFIEANLGAGYDIKDVCEQLIHPATGQPPTPAQLRAAFPNACKPGAALLRMTAELYNTAMYGERGDKFKAQELWLKTRDEKRWAGPAKKVDLNVQGAVEHKHKVDDAISQVVGILDAIAVRKKKNGDDAKLIEHQQADLVGDVDGQGTVEDVEYADPLDYDG